MNISKAEKPRGLWLTQKYGSFDIRPTTRQSPGENEKVIANRAVAINPNDWLMQSIGGLIYPWLKYPFVPGTDVSGTVVEIGSKVTRFKVGDRVLGNAVGCDKNRNNAAEGGFQTYTLLLDHMASVIPDTLPFEDAAVIPLAASTAACGLFQKDHLALRFPSFDVRPTREAILIWGGSTSVGSNAIQLAVAAGYEVFTTASPRNFDYVRKLGATSVYDYSSASVVADVIKAFEGKKSVGALAIGPGSAKACLQIVAKIAGNRFVSMATPPISFDDAPVVRSRWRWVASTLPKLIWANVSMISFARMKGVRMKFIFGTTLIANDVGSMLYRDFLPSALAEGRYVAAPPPLIAGKGIEAIPAAIERQKSGVSARKVVVTL